MKKDKFKQLDINLIDGILKEKISIQKGQQPIHNKLVENDLNDDGDFNNVGIKGKRNYKAKKTNNTPTHSYNFDGV